MTPDQLPEDLTEFLDVWCDDLLEVLEPGVRRQLVSGVQGSYKGGPWPDRVEIQRQAEMLQNILTVDATVGLLLIYRFDGIDGAISRLDSDTRNDAMGQLGKMPGTAELVAKVNEAHRDGLISESERVTILTNSARQPIAPPLKPLPAHLRPLPVDYPESFLDWARRNREQKLDQPSDEQSHSG